jgi:hypothetical protein
MENEIDINKKSAKEIIDAIFHKHEGEHTIAIVSAAINVIPWIGGSLSSLLNDYMPNASQERLKNYLISLALDSDNIQNQLKENREALDKRIKTDEFEFIFIKCLKAVQENYQQEKLNAYRAILLNSILEDNPTEQKEYFLHILNSLTVTHLNILSFMNNPEEYLFRRSIDKSDIRGGHVQIFRKVMPNIDIELIKVATEELYQLGFTNSGKNMFGITTSTQGLGLIKNKLSPLGSDFIKFITTPTA